MTLRYVIVVIAAICTFKSAEAQISKINYQIKFNEQANLFDCYFVVKDGQAVDLKDRAQFNAQYTIIVPTGTTLEIEKNYNPIQSNQRYTGNKPTQWVVSNVVRKPESNPGYDYFSIAPSLAPAAFYNDLKSGEEVKLFSIKVYPITECGANIKIFQNGRDLNSGARGMFGGDFSNGFTMGGIEQKYGGNEERITPKANIIQDVKASQTKGIRLESQLVSDSPYAPFSTQWFGPASFYSEAANVSIANPSKDQYGTYKLVVTDARGCQDVKDVSIINIAQDIKASVPVQAVDINENTKNSTQAILKLNSEVVGNIGLYPNPATTNLIVSITGNKGSKVQADILDINGRVTNSNVINQTMSNKDEIVELSVNHLLSGIYTLSVKMDGKDLSKKFMVLK
ncbi:MAG: T9SS type A sorting domain-containing protein [Saprospiraceae bacterium]